MESISKKYTYLAMATVFVVILVFTFWPKTKNTKPINPNLKIVAFGDSLVFGVGSTQGNDFVSRLSQKIVVPIVNAGVSGNTTRDGLARIEKDVLAQKPDLVLVLLGGNDALRQVPVSQTFSNLENIIVQIQNSGAKVLLLGIRGGVLFLGKDYDTEFEKLAKKTKVVLVPDVLEGVFGKKNLMFDQIHPNDKGYEIIANKVEKYLREMLR